MINHKKYIIAALGAFCCFFLALGLALIIPSAEAVAAEVTWSPVEIANDWTSNGADGVWEATGNGSSANQLKADSTDFNTLSFDFVIKKYYTSGTLGVLLTEDEGSNKVWFLRIATGEGHVQIVDASNGETYLAAAAGWDYFGADENTTRHVEFHWEEGLLAVSINGKPVVAYGNKDGYQGAQLKEIVISSYAMDIKISNIETKKTEKTPFFWFSENIAVGGWKSKGSMTTNSSEGGTRERLVYIQDNDGGNVVEMHHSGEFPGNTVTFKVDSCVLPADNSNFGMQFSCNGGKATYFFEYTGGNNGMLRLRKLAGSTEFLLGSKDNVTLTPNMEFKFVFDGKIARIYVGDELAVSARDAGRQIRPTRLLLGMGRQTRAQRSYRYEGIHFRRRRYRLRIQ